MYPWLRKTPLGVPEIPPVTFGETISPDVGLGPGVRPPQVNLPSPDPMVGTYAPPPQPQQDFGGFGTIKQGSVLGPSPQQDSIYNPPPPEPLELSLEDRITNAYNKIYTPEHKYQDQMGQMLEQFPVREKPSFWRRLASIPVGHTYGPEAQEKYINRSFNQKLGDWKEKFDPTYKAATVEKGENINERMLATQTAGQMVAADRANTAAAGEDRRQKTAEANIERDKKRNAINEFKAKNPNWKTEEAGDGYIWMIPPRPDMGQPFNTGLRHGDVDELQKHQWRMEEIGARGEQARLTQKEKRDDPSNPARYWIEDTFDKNGNHMGSVRIDKVSGTVLPVTTAQGEPVVTGRISTDDITAQAALKMMILKINDPVLGPLIEIVNNMPTVSNSATPAQRQQISNFIFGQESSITNQNQSQNVPPPGAPPGGTWRTDSTGKRIYEVPSYARPMRSNTAGTGMKPPVIPAAESEPAPLPDFTTPAPQSPQSRGRGAGSRGNVADETPFTDKEVDDAKIALAGEGKTSPTAFEIIAKIRAMRGTRR